MEGWEQNINQYLTPRRQRIFLIGVILLYTLFLSYQINEPFIGDNEELNGMNGISASNWIRLGPAELKFAQMTIFGAADAAPGAESFYLNHPNFLIVPLAFSYWAFYKGIPLILPNQLRLFESFSL